MGTGGAVKPAKSAGAKPWLSDPDFLAVWDGYTQEGRDRSGRKLAWAAWLKARKDYSAEEIEAGLRRYRKDDPDVARTGGPAFHIWLRDKCEAWVEASRSSSSTVANWSLERWAIAVELFRVDGAWSAEMGPAPGQPGCKVPASLMIRPAQAVA